MKRTVPLNTVSKLRLRRIIVLLSLVSFAILLTFHSHSAASERKLIREEKKLEDVKKRIEERRGSVKEAEVKEKSILGELEAINKDLNDINWRLKQTGKEVNALKKKVRKTNDNLLLLKREKAELRKRLLERLRAIYHLRGVNKVRASFLYNSTVDEDIGNRKKLMAIIMDADMELIESVSKNLSAIESEKLRLTGLKREKEKARSVFRRQKIKADTERLKKKRFLSSMRREKKRLKSLLDELKGAATNLTGLIKDLKKNGPVEAVAKGFALMKGKLPKPIDGSVISSYGRVKHPQYGTVTFNNGIVIKAELGRPVKSVHDGRVAYVGELKGYGQVVILEHEGGYYTLFGHLYKVLVKRGEAVKKGFELGLVGDYGLSDVSGLYFEVRQGGVPRDPVSWFARR